jgi:hypothetical protein
MRIDLFVVLEFWIYFETVVFSFFDYFKTFLNSGFYLYSVSLVLGSICGFSLTLFTLCPFETKKKSIFYFFIFYFLFLDKDCIF